MFAKLKKKIQDEGGITATDAGEKQPPSGVGDGSLDLKTSNQSYIHNSNADYQLHKKASTSSLDSENTTKEKDVQHEKPVLASPNESFTSTSKEELVELLLKRTQQVKTFDAKLSELTSLVKEKNQHIEKLETELEKQQDLMCQRLQDINEQYHSGRAKLSESIATAVKKKEDDLRLEMQELEKAKLRLEERLSVLQMEKDHCVRNSEERETMETAANEERTKLRNLLLQAQAEAENYKKVISENTSISFDKKETLAQISQLTQQKNEAERKNQSQDELIISLRSSNESLEKQLKLSKDAYAQLALQNNQDEWLEKQIESERTITTLEEEISKLKIELSHKEKERNIVQQQLNERAQEILDFKTKVGKLETELQLKSARVGEVEQLYETSSLQLADALKDKESFRQRSDELSQQCESIRQSLSDSKSEVESIIKEKGELISDLESQLTKNNTQLEVTNQQLSELQDSKLTEHKVLETEEISRLKEELADVHASLQEKNKTIKKQEQRLADLKKLLQRELKVMPSNSDQIITSTNGAGFQNSIDAALQQIALADVAETSLLNHSMSGTAAAAAAMLPITHSFTQSENRRAKPGPGDNRSTGIRQNDSFSDSLAAMASGQGIGSNSDYNFTRELNFKYLRHVVLKFMLSRETEAIQLIKAVSMLLHFTPEEQKLIKDTLEWKMSWFGSRPQLPAKGQTAKVIPPSF